MTDLRVFNKLHISVSLQRVLQTIHGKDIMKKWWKVFLTKRNKGLSLVELVCSIAIFGMVTVMVGGAMVVSANSYNRGATEIDLQQDAQIAANILTNLVIDSDQIMEPSGPDVSNVLKVEKDGIEYSVYLDSDPVDPEKTNLMYKQSDDSDPALLAEYIDTFDLRLLPGEKNVEVTLGFNKGGRTFTSSYSITPRNAVAGDGESVSTAYIDIADKVVLEPLETFDFRGAVVHGGTNNNLEWGPINGSTDTTNTRLENGVLKIGKDEKASEISFVVNTAQKSESGLPLASKTVTVYIRRVNKVKLTASLVSGTAYTAGAEYRITANVEGSNLRDINAVNGGYTYVMDDKCESVVFRDALCDLGGIANVVSRQEDVKGSSILIKLTQDMPAGGKISIGGESRHAAGITNKATPMSYAYLTDVVTIEKPSTGVISNTNGIRRNDDAFFETNINVTDLRDSYGVYADGTRDGSAQTYWFYRIREKTTGSSWSEFRQMQEGGSAKKLNSDESKRFLPDRSYEMEIIITVINRDSKILYWPKDSSLLADGTGFEGFSQGWSEGVTSKTEYSTIFDVSKVQLAFKGNETFNIPDGSVSFGSSTNPIKLDTKGQEFIVEMASFNSMNAERYQNNLKVYIEKWDGSSWQPSGENGWHVQPGFPQIRITNQTGPNEGDPAGKGLYRLGIYIDKNADFRDIGTGGIFDQNLVGISSTNDYTLCDPISGAGYIYVLFPSGS